MGKQGPIRYWKVRGPRPGTDGRADPTQAVNYADLIAFGGAGGGGPPPVGVGALLEGRYVNIHGDTMDPGTTIALGRDPTAPAEAATKAYVDARVFQDAPSDGTPYERQDGGWVPAAGGTEIEAGLGLTLDDTVTPNVMHLEEATDADIGGITEPPTDGLSYARRYDQTAADWLWEPTITPGLQITGLIPEKALAGDPSLTVHAYGSEFTDTCQIVWDGAPVATAYVSETELTFEVDPSGEAVERVVTVKVQDGANQGAGAEAFEFIVTTMEIAGETPPDVGVIYVPPDEGLVLEPDGKVTLAIAGKTAVERGGVFVPDDRGLSLNSEGSLALKPASSAEIGGIREPDDPAGQATWVRTGDGRWVPAPLPGGDPPPLATHSEPGLVRVPARNKHSQGLDLDTNGFLYAPPATHEHLGTIVEPPVGRELWGRSYDDNDNPRWEAFDPVEDVPENATETFGRTARGWVPLAMGRGGVIGDQLLYVRLDGDQMRGALLLAHEGAVAMEAVTVSQLDRVRDLIPDDAIGEPPADPVAIWGRSSAGARGWLEVPTFDHLEGFVAKIGDTMRGPLTLDGPPTEPLHAATKDYVDLSEPQEAPHNGKAHARQDGQWVEIDATTDYRLPVATRTVLGGVMIDDGLDVTLSGGLSLRRASPNELGGIFDPPYDDANPNQSFTRRWGQWVEAEDTSGYVSKIGDTMTGPLVLSGAPTQPRHAVTMDWADLTFIKDAPADGKPYARNNEQWVEVEDTAGMQEPPMSPVAIWGRSSGGARGWIALDQTGVTVAGDTAAEVGVIYVQPDRGLNLGADGGISLRPAGQYPDLGGMFEAPLNDGPYVRDNGQWAKLPEAASDFVTVGRSPIQALDEGFDDVLQKRSLFVPLATDTLAGAIVEPPVDGKQYARTNDTANGPAWVENIAKGVHTDDAPPMTPSDGALWWKSSTGALYVFYEDIDSGQWVQVNGTPSPDATISTGDTPPSNPRPNQLWFESDRGSLFFWYADADSSQWVEILGGSGGTAGSAPPVDLTNYVTHQQLADAVIDAQAFVTAASNGAVGHDTDLCQQALKAVEGLAVSVKQLQKGHLALKARIQKLEAR